MGLLSSMTRENSSFVEKELMGDLKHCSSNEYVTS